MGDFRITIEAAGAHCCGNQDVKSGEVFDHYGCGMYSCPDCKARRLVDELMRAGYIIHTAKIEHWPAGHIGQVHYPEDGNQQVTDDFKAGIGKNGWLGPAKRRRGK